MITGQFYVIRRLLHAQHVFSFAANTSLEVFRDTIRLSFFRGSHLSEFQTLLVIQIFSTTILRGGMSSSYIILYRIDI